MEGEDAVQCRWEDWGQTLASACRQLRRQGDASLITDVTLCAGDSHCHFSFSSSFSRARQFVLSACSGFFRSVLTGREPWQQPVALLRGTAFPALQLIIHFLYEGTVELKDSQLEEFMALEGNLDVAGISDRTTAGDTENSFEVIGGK